MSLASQIVLLAQNIGAKIKSDRERLVALESRKINYFNAAGPIAPPTKKWTTTITNPTTSNGLEIDISSAGFTSILICNVFAFRDTATVTACPQASGKKFTTSAGVITKLTVYIVEGNNATVALLGINVLSGAPVIFSPTTGLTIYVEITGN